MSKLNSSFSPPLPTTLPKPALLIPLNEKSILPDVHANTPESSLTFLSSVTPVCSVTQTLSEEHPQTYFLFHHPGWSSVIMQSDSRNSIPTGVSHKNDTPVNLKCRNIPSLLKSIIRLDISRQGEVRQWVGGHSSHSALEPASTPNLSDPVLYSPLPCSPCHKHIDLSNGPQTFQPHFLSGQNSISEGYLLG